jgi:hypothetical protein
VEEAKAELGGAELAQGERREFYLQPQLAAAAAGTPGVARVRAGTVDLFLSLRGNTVQWDRPLTPGTPGPVVAVHSWPAAPGRAVRAQGTQLIAQLTPPWAVASAGRYAGRSSTPDAPAASWTDPAGSGVSVRIAGGGEEGVLLVVCRGRCDDEPAPSAALRVEAGARSPSVSTPVAAPSPRSSRGPAPIASAQAWGATDISGRQAGQPGGHGAPPPPPRTPRVPAAAPPPPRPTEFVRQQDPAPMNSDAARLNARLNALELYLEQQGEGAGRK